MIHREPLVKHHETLEHSSFDATISALDAETSALDVETSAFGAATLAIARRSFDATISALDEETSAVARSYWRYRRGDIGDCGVGITKQMYNRVTNHGDTSTFSKPEDLASSSPSDHYQHRPLRKLSSSNRVTPVSIQDGV